MNEIMVGRRIIDAIAEYEAKNAAITQTIANFEQAGRDLLAAVTIGGTYGQENIETGHAPEWKLRKNLLKSAWLNVYNGLNIEQIASAKDKSRFKQELENPIEFTLANIRATFGNYISDPRGNILRGLAEVFSDLDPVYKSHEKVKIGVKGLPKRVILSGVDGYGWGRDRLNNVVNALAAVQGKPLACWNEIDLMLKDPAHAIETRGIWLKRYSNGNGHLFFDDQALRDINMGLAEYYGDVLPDAHESNATPQASTAVSKDLQYYPTPMAVVNRIMEMMNIKGEMILEPSCGCGRFLDAIRSNGGMAYGIEYDQSRAEIAKNKGHSVLRANFLQVEPMPKFDKVIMNPPFYGKHYAKHIEHALKFLKDGGKLIAILPATARYDHGLLKRGQWQDLPTGSFSESGTNVAITIYTTFK